MRIFQEPIEAIQENTRSLSESVAELKSEIKSMEERFDGIETMLRSLIVQQAGKTYPHKS